MTLSDNYGDTDDSDGIDVYRYTITVVEGANDITVTAHDNTAWIISRQAPVTSSLAHTTFTRTATAGSGSSASFGTLTSAPRASDTVDTTGATDMGTFVLNEENNWEHIFYELPQYSSDGKYKYTYFVQEITTGYDVTYDNNAGIVEGVITITNAKKVPTTKSLSVTKLWKDESWTTEHMDKNAYVLTTAQTRYFKLLDNEKDVTDSIPGIVGATISDGYIVLTTAAGTSSASFKINEIPIGGKYEFKEYELITGADGTKTYVEARDYSVEHTAGSNDYTIVNQLTDITIYKVWADASDKLVYTRPAVEFELWRTLANGTDELVEKKTMVSPSTALTWDMLPLTDGNGHTYSYYVKEVLPNGFTSADGNVEVAQGGGGTITNTPTELTVQKVWKDYFGQAITKTEGTIYYKLMQQKVSFSEGKETTVGEAVAYLPTVFELTPDADPSNSDNDWKNVHSVLPRYWENSADGTAGEYRYFVIETDKDGNQIYAQYDKISVDVATPQTITITNTLTEIHVKKIWSVAGGDLPDPLPDITLQLRYNYVGGGVQATEDPIAFETVLSVKNNNFTVSRDEKGNVFWAYAWTNLPTHDIINGEAKQRYYYVVEPKDKIPEGFRQVVGTGEAVQMNNIGITGNTSSEGVIEITNELISYTLPETGGAGTTPYTVCGLLLMTAAMALMYKELTRKKLRGEGRES